MRRTKINTGDKYGDWTAIQFNRVDEQNRIYWDFQCKCGDIGPRWIWNVINGKSKGCRSCYSERRRSDISPGAVFGSWTAIEFTKNIKKKGQYWLFRCLCGTEKEFLAAEARNGRTTQCKKCANKEHSIFISGENHPNWNGGRTMTKNGYVLLYDRSEHPNSQKNGYILEHVLVMSESLERPLFSHEEVHHINGIRDDNHLSNLELWSTSHPSGQRVADKVEWAFNFLKEEGLLLKPCATCAAVLEDFKIKVFLD